MSWKATPMAIGLLAMKIGVASARVTGRNILDPTSPPIRFDAGSSQAFGFAPAIEYSWKGNLGVIFGVRVIPAGRNTSATITPAVAINMVY